jgi:hypothetical protein
MFNFPADYVAIIDGAGAKFAHDVDSNNSDLILSPL